MRIVAGSAKGRLLKSPRGRKIRPTSDKVKSAFFNITSDYINNASFLDLFSGTGNIGLEALSRGAGRAVFVEKDSYSVQLIRENILLTGMQKFATVLPCDVYRALKILGEKKELFNIIYIDPPYKYQGIEELVQLLSKENLVENGGIIAVERDSHTRERETWLENSPFQPWQRKIYGNTLLVLLKNLEILNKDGV
ncbi:MAG: 16S rRNA (guanine(966)-N(2))-methyltransferase RsmD [Dethiobacter sp.]|jgi:16S rRNA (guanine(966)-N(2))-methyltransferase RsmD|nr:MAG: 16S rRNA (guanine(966)-N(2))-methyltransferase RsmD [Dethiobacter sp.]